MAYQPWSVVAGEQPSAAKWNYLGTNDAFFEDFIIGTNGVHAAWTSFTPSWTNLTVGNGTNTGYYVKYGTTVLVRYKFIMGSTSSMGTDPWVAVPVNASANFVTTSNRPTVMINIEDSGSGTYWGFARFRATSQGIELYVGNVASTYLGGSSITSTTPMTWTTNDAISFQVFYEATS